MNMKNLNLNLFKHTGRCSYHMLTVLNKCLPKKKKSKQCTEVLNQTTTTNTSNFGTDPTLPIKWLNVPLKKRSGDWRITFALTRYFSIYGSKAVEQTNSKLPKGPTKVSLTYLHISFWSPFFFFSTKTPPLHNTVKFSLPPVLDKLSLTS